jgi:Spy/CpxP family protein refolding chaperone
MIQWNARKKMKQLLFATLLTGGLWAQSTLPAPGFAIGGPYPPGAKFPGNSYTALKTFLALTDDQVTQLQTVQQAKFTAIGKVQNDIQTKELALQQLLSQSSQDANAIGTLMVESQNLQKSIANVSKPFHDQALAVLTPDQVKKLAALSDALKFAPTAYEAVGLDLIESPNGGVIGMVGPANRYIPATTNLIRGPVRR